MCLRTPDIYLSQSQTDQSAMNNASGAIVEGRGKKQNEILRESFLLVLALPLRAKSSRETTRRSPL